MPDFVFSFNFLPVVSKVCSKEAVTYVSWIYDNPENDDERKEIAKNAHDKVAREHTFDVRVKQIVELVKSR